MGPRGIRKRSGGRIGWVCCLSDISPRSSEVFSLTSLALGDIPIYPAAPRPRRGPSESFRVTAWTFRNVDREGAPEYRFLAEVPARGSQYSQTAIPESVGHTFARRQKDMPWYNRWDAGTVEHLRKPLEKASKGGVPLFRVEGGFRYG